MARLMNTLPKVVFSQSLSEVGWNNARLTRRPLERGDPGAQARGRQGHRRLRRRPHRPQPDPGAVVDEYRLTVHPVALGEGLSLMHGLPEPQRFELVSSTAYADGCVSQVLRPG